MIKRSFAPFADAQTRVLVLGSLPGDRSLAEARYYAHPQNQFWRLISAAIGHDIAALPYDARVAALRTARIGLWDVAASAERTGSTDAAIRDLVGNDLPGLIATLPALRAVAFNGGTAWKHGRKLFGETLSAANLALVPLPSSSALHTIGVNAKLPAWAALREYLG